MAIVNKFAVFFSNKEVPSLLKTCIHIYIYTLEWFECMEPSTVHCVTLNTSLTFLVNLSLEIHASQLELRGHRDMYLEHRKV